MRFKMLIAEGFIKHTPIPYLDILLDFRVFCYHLKGRIALAPTTLP